MKRITFLLSLLLCFAAHAVPVRVCFVGDSITEGFYPATRGHPSYLAAMHAGTDFGVKNAAHSGDKVAAAQLIFDREIAGTHLRGCTHVLFLIGTNDLPDGTSAATIHTGIMAMCNAVVAKGKKCGLLYVLPRGTGASASADLETRRRALNALLAGDTTASILPIDTDTPLREAQSSFTGATPTAWAPTTGYTAGDIVSNNGYRYICLTSGTSDGSGGPTTTSVDITDGSAHWTYLPALLGGTYDGLHPDNTRQALIASTVDAAAHAAGWW